MIPSGTKFNMFALFKDLFYKYSNRSQMKPNGTEIDMFALFKDQFCKYCQVELA